jgi:hypothetical protein
MNTMSTWLWQKTGYDIFQSGLKTGRAVTMGDAHDINTEVASS